MSAKDNIFSGKIKDKAIFDFSELYRFCYTWLVEEDYIVEEKVYSEKVTSGGKEVEIKWDAKQKISDYFLFQLKITWRIIGLKEVEVEKEGKKIKMSKGNIEIKISANLVRDYESKWESKPLLKFLRGVYNKFIIPGRIDQYEGKIYSDADEFLAQAKSFLSLEGKH